MQRVGGHLLCSPLDLAGFIACEHLTQLELAVALGQRTRPAFENAYADLIRRKGDEHERAFLEELRAAGHAVTQVGLGEGRDFEAAARAILAQPAVFHARVDCGGAGGAAAGGAGDRAAAGGGGAGLGREVAARAGRRERAVFPADGR